MPRLASLATVFGGPRRADTPPARPTAAEIEAWIAAAQTELDPLIAEHGAVALAAVSGDSDAEQREAEITEKITGLESIVRRLTVALQAAKAHEEAAARELRLEAQAGVRERVKKLVVKRAKYAADFEAAIGQAVQAFRNLHELNTRACAAYPFPAQANGSCLHSGELVNIASHEIFRLGAVPAHLGGAASHPEHSFPSMPGGKCPDMRFVAQPDRITPLREVIEAANATAIRVLEAGIATAPLLPASATEGEE